jgi:hypothetical protein
MDGSGSPLFALTWRATDMPAGPPICQQRALARRISGKGFTGWPTPTANEYETSDPERVRVRRAETKARVKNGNGFGLTLGQITAMEVIGPTPSGSPAGTANTGQLNPKFSLWLMGLPKLWLVYSPSRK